MYRPKDSDIFGTANIGYAPRIINNEQIDPNAAFKRRAQDNYENYSSKIQNVNTTITLKPLDTTKVNEKASFDDDYHRKRKERDLKSTIFYESNYPSMPRLEQSKQNDGISINKEANFGKKETLKRQVKQLPINQSGLKGNSSRIFDLDTRISVHNCEKQVVYPLIPHQMQWDQHDSVRYAHINHNTQGNQNEIKSNLVSQIKESQSTVFENKSEIQQNIKNVQEELETKKQVKKPFAKKEAVKAKARQIQILIMKGWDSKFMQGLSKHCKLNKTAIVKFLIQQDNKVTISITDSPRWENVTDWLRKDCKLKIRVLH